MTEPPDDDWWGEVVPTDEEDAELEPRKLRIAPAVSDENRWQLQLATNGKGNPLKLPGNVVAILHNDPRFRGVLGWSDFDHSPMWLKEPEWVCPPIPFPGLGEHSESHDVYVAQWLERHHGFSLPQTGTRLGVLGAARCNRYHPVRDYLQALKWDGVQRLESVPQTHFGADARPSHAACFVMWMISAVARAMKPGEKVDGMLVLEGSEGSAKSSAVIALVGRDWVNPKLPNLRDENRAVHAMLGNWVVINDELSGQVGVPAETVRDFLTREFDFFRRPYGRDMERVQRQCVFVGTTNRHQYHGDDRGRRYLPIRVTHIDIEAIRRDRDQLWAEAYARWDSGEKWWTYHDESALTELAAEQQDRRESDEWETVIAKYLAAGNLDQVTPVELLGRVFPDAGVDKWTLRDQRRVGDIMRQLGWTRKRVQLAGVRQWMFCKE